MIRFDRVRKVLGGRPVLDGVEFSIERGETFVIVGPSGAGKSVTLKHMVRLMTPDEGCVTIDGEDIASASGKRLERLRERFGFLFQGAALLEWLTVLENVALPLREKTTMDNEAILAKARRMLDMVGLAADAAKYPSEISGGMRKRAGLARAIVRDPEIVLYDEPTSGLDPVTSRTIDGLIETLRQELHVTGVVVTHDLHSALSIGARIAMLHGGRMVEIAEPGAFIASANPEVQSFLASQFITRDGHWERKKA